jgi:hypothetical protein
MKYGNKKVIVDGITFDSKKEARRYTELKLYEKAGKIHSLELQKVFELIPAQYEEKFTGERYKRGVNKGAPKLKKVCLEKAVTYKADFAYYVNNGHNTFVVEDTKGMRTKDYIIKRKLMLYVHQIRIREV